MAELHKMTLQEKDIDTYNALLDVFLDFSVCFLVTVSNQEPAYCEVQTSRESGPIRVHHTASAHLWDPGW